MHIAADDVLFLCHVHYNYTHKEYDYKVAGYPKPIISQSIKTKVEVIGPYTRKGPIKGMITRFRDRHSRDSGFEVTDIKVFKTEFEWKEEDL